MQPGATHASSTRLQESYFQKGPEKQTLSGWDHIIERSGRLLQRLVLIERRLSAADIKIRPLHL